MYTICNINEGNYCAECLPENHNQFCHINNEQSEWEITPQNCESLPFLRHAGVALWPAWAKVVRIFPNGWKIFDERTDWISIEKIFRFVCWQKRSQVFWSSQSGENVSHHHFYRHSPSCLYGPAATLHTKSIKNNIFGLHFVFFLTKLCICVYWGVFIELKCVKSQNHPLFLTVKFA